MKREELKRRIDVISRKYLVLEVYGNRDDGNPAYLRKLEREYKEAVDTLIEDIDQAYRKNLLGDPRLVP